MISLRRYTCHFCYFSQDTGLCAAHSLVRHQTCFRDTCPSSQHSLAVTRNLLPCEGVTRDEMSPRVQRSAERCPSGAQPCVFLPESNCTVSQCLANSRPPVSAASLLFPGLAPKSEQGKHLSCNDGLPSRLTDSSEGRGYAGSPPPRIRTLAKGPKETVSLEWVPGSLFIRGSCKDLLLHLCGSRILGEFPGEGRHETLRGTHVIPQPCTRPLGASASLGPRGGHGCCVFPSHQDSGPVPQASS